jgi:hypothetical protein
MSHSAITRRTVIVAGAALAAPAIGLVESETTDPIIVAIKRHRVALDAFKVAVNHEFNIKEEIPSDKRRSHYCGGDLDLCKTDDPRWPGAIKATHDTIDEMEEAALAVLDTEPTTFTGVIALLAHAEANDVYEMSPRDLDTGDGYQFGYDWHYCLCQTVARALAKIAQVKS